MTTTVNKTVFTSAFLIGCLVVLWICSIFATSAPLALLITIVIGAIFGVGAFELFKYRFATQTLNQALLITTTAVSDLENWLSRLDPALQHPVRMRIQGDRTGLPVPVLTPYFLGLLVMLGLLGTFVGMVDTLRGAVVALEGTTDLEAVRAGLAAPIKGLGLAFGTSIAGVATSAALGLMSTICKRDRTLAVRHLDKRVPDLFQDFSLVHSQQETFKALQRQTHALPEISAKLEKMVQKLEAVGETLVTNQTSFHASVESTFSDLAASIHQTHQESIAENTRLAAESIKPVARDVMNAVTADTRLVHQQLSQTMEAYVHTLSEQLQTQINRLLNTSEDLVKSRIQTESAWVEEHQKRVTDLSRTLTDRLMELRDDEKQRGQAAVNRLERLESTITDHLAALGKAMEAPMAGLIRSVEQVPTAVAEVISRLKQEVSERAKQDTVQLDAQKQVLSEISALSDRLSRTSTAQHEAIQSLVDRTGKMLEEVASGFSSRITAEADGFSEVSAHFAESAVEMASLGDAFFKAVSLFNQSNDHLVENLTRIEAALERSAERSDEQLGYYVAQAREIIDHCMLSQKEIFEDFQKLNQREKAIMTG